MMLPTNAVVGSAGTPLFRKQFLGDVASIRALTTHGFFALFVIGASMVGLEPATFLIVCGIVATFVYPLLAYRESLRVRLKLSPINFYFLWYSVGLGPSAIFAGVLISIRPFLGFGAATLAPEDLIPGYLLFICGSFALHLGLELFRPPTKKHYAAGSCSNGLWPLVFATSIGIILELTDLRSSLGTLSQPLSVAPYALLLAIALGNSRDWRLSQVAYGALLAGGTLALLVWSLRTGAKSAIMYSFIPILWGMVTHRSRRWMIVPATILCTISYLTFVMPIITTYRNSGYNTSYGGPSLAQAIEIYSGKSSSEEVDSVTWIPSPIEAFLERQFESSAASFLYREVATDGLRYGETFQDLLVALIPRVLYPDKPALSRGTWFYSYTGTTADVAPSNLGMTAIGEWYWNFGWFGVIVGMTITGSLLSALLWREAGDNPASDSVKLLLYLVSILQMNQMPDSTNPILGCVASAIIFRFVQVVFGRGKIRQM